MTDSQSVREVKNKAMQSVRWTVLAQVVSRTIQPLTLLVLALFLEPADFGLATLATLVVTFSQMFVDAGLGRALIQTDKELPVAANVVFWTSLVLGIMLFVGVFGLAPLAGSIYSEPLLASILRISGLQLIILAFGVVPSALLQRAFNFKMLFWSRLIASLTTALVAIPLAALGFGVWALVYGALIAAGAQVGMLWLGNPWRPKLTFSREMLQHLLSFSLWVVLEGGLGWFYSWADCALLGAFLGLHELGIYRVGSTVVAVLFGLVTTPLLPVLYGSLCRLKADRGAFIRMAGKFGKLFATVLLPLSVGLFLLGDPVAHSFFDSKWKGMGVVISYLSLVQGWTWFLSGVNTEAFRAMGRPDVYPKLMAVCLLYYAPAYLWAAPLGLFFFLKVRLAMNFLTLPVHIWLSCRYMGVSNRFYWEQSRLVWPAIGSMVLIVIGSQEVIQIFAAGRLSYLLQVFIAGSLGAVVFISAMAFFDRVFVGEAWDLCRKAVRSESQK